MDLKGQTNSNDLDLVKLYIMLHGRGEEECSNASMSHRQWKTRPIETIINQKETD